MAVTIITTITTTAVIGTAATWLGILLSYDSYYWTPDGRSWPVSFFVVSLVFVIYLLSGLAVRCSKRRFTDAREASSILTVGSES